MMSRFRMVVDIITIYNFFELFVLKMISIVYTSLLFIHYHSVGKGIMDLCI